MRVAVALALAALILFPAAIPAQTHRAPTSLEAIKVVGESSCAAEASAGDIGLVWAAARRALSAVQRAAEQGPPSLRVERFERERDADGRVVAERTEESVVAASAPFRTLPPRILSSDGYRMQLEGYELLFAPDAATLLSEEFAIDHCFKLVADPRLPEAIGLAFVPSPLREVVDIAGTFWLDRESSTLRSVEYLYRNAGEFAEAARAGGRLEFGGLGSHSSAITAWEVRTPRIARIRPMNLQSRELTPRDSLVGVREEGARLAALAMAPASGTRATGSLVGRLIDPASSSGGLLGARVVVLGTTLGALTDSLGRFALEKVPVGPVTVRVDHERLRLFRVVSRINTEVRDGVPTEIALAVPSGAAAWRAVCPQAVGGPVRGAIVARLIDATLGHGVASASVQATWRGRLIPTRVRTGAERAESDELGHVVLCDVSSEVPVRLSVKAAGYREARLTVAVRAGGVVERSIALESCRANDASPGCS